MRILPFGPDALLVEVVGLAEVLALHRRLRASRPDGVVDLVPAARTVLVQVDPRQLPLDAAAAWVRAAADRTDVAPEPATAPPDGPELTLDVVYDGPDLDDAARAAGVSPDALVERHVAASWTVAFTGFAPGFAYLVSPDWSFDIPRRDAPRTRVPAGSVALAAGFCGAYPRPTPGGWQLIGTTAAVLFDVDAAHPALLRAGMSVRFRAVRAGGGPALMPSSAPIAAGVVPSPLPAGVDPSAPATAPDRRLPAAPAPVPRRPRATADGAIDILAAAPGTTVQDLGRPGRAGEGIAVSGALDRGALRLANRLVGNDEHAAAFEITLGGFRARARRALWVAATGGVPVVHIDGRTLEPGRAQRWPAGTELRVDTPVRGIRTVLAVRGGLGGAAVAGSRATDTLAGLGTAPVHTGDVYGIVDAASAPIPPAPDVTPLAAFDLPNPLEIAVAPGPRADWFPPSARAVLTGAVWTVSPHSDRVGLRLSGPALRHDDAGELSSEPMRPGAVQVPPDGAPVVLLADGPVTGGYPVIAVVHPAGLDLLAQAAPGTPLRFTRRHPPR